MYYLGIFFFWTQFNKNKTVLSFLILRVDNNPAIRSFCLLVLSVQVRHSRRKSSLSIEEDN